MPAGVVGLPNVGKSSLINSLKRARVAQVGNAPGVTRSVQQVSLDKHISLLDSPGMVFSASQPGDSWAALRNCIKVRRLLWEMFLGGQDVSCAGLGVLRNSQCAFLEFDL